jgi:hypothetical protein
VGRGLTSPKMKRRLALFLIYNTLTYQKKKSPKMKRGIESLEGLALCRINQILGKSRF